MFICIHLPDTHSRDSVPFFLETYNRTYFFFSFNCREIYHAVSMSVIQIQTATYTDYRPLIWHIKSYHVWITNEEEWECDLEGKNREWHKTENKNRRIVWVYPIMTCICLDRWCRQKKWGGGNGNLYSCMKLSSLQYTCHAE